ncbi:MAG: FMN-binding protein [Gammaproteobacteria bacterium]|nr:FMN-binding protein [Gammaproteobacteria bacterium]
MRERTLEWLLDRALSLTVIAAGCAGLLALTQHLTKPRIERNLRAHELRLVTELAGTRPPTSTTWSNQVWDLCNNTALAREEAAGYGGAIALMIAVSTANAELRLGGLRVIGHQETPGLADFIAQPEIGWLADLKGRSLAEIKDIDAVAGATITSRALLVAVSGALARVQAHDFAAQECAP